MSGGFVDTLDGARGVAVSLAVELAILVGFCLSAVTPLFLLWIYAPLGAEWVSLPLDFGIAGSGAYVFHRIVNRVTGVE